MVKNNEPKVIYEFEKNVEVVLEEIEFLSGSLDFFMKK